MNVVTMNSDASSSKTNAAMMLYGTTSSEENTPFNDSTTTNAAPMHCGSLVPALFTVHTVDC